ncbi:MAG: hypothetical protein AAFP69_24310, partial [Planctomycetota bacterium]
IPTLEIIGFADILEGVHSLAILPLRSPPGDQSPDPSDVKSTTRLMLGVRSVPRPPHPPVPFDGVPTDRRSRQRIHHD